MKSGIIKIETIGMINKPEEVVVVSTWGRLLKPTAQRISTDDKTHPPGGTYP